MAIKFQGQLTEGKLGSDKVLLLKPETFMNKSGQSVGESMRFYKLEPSDVIVFHDELDLAPANAASNRAAAMQATTACAPSTRISARITAAFALASATRAWDLVSHYVLQDFAKADADWLDDLLRGISDGAPELAAGHNDKFLNAVSLRTAPARSSKSTPKPQADAKPQANAKPAAKPDAPSAPSDTEDRSPLQKLMDKFR